MTDDEVLASFTPAEACTLTSLLQALFPMEPGEPTLVDIGVPQYIGKALSDVYADRVEVYRAGIAALDRSARTRFAAPFAACTQSEQYSLVCQLEAGPASQFDTPPAAFLQMVIGHLQEGLFADPAYGGNRNKAGWRLLGHPGVWLQNSPEENLTAEPVTKGGRIQSMADLGFTLTPVPQDTQVAPGYDLRRGTLPPAENIDVVLVGCGGIGAVVAPVLAGSGLKVLALEAGPWRTSRDFLPDELGAAYYCRANMGSKFAAEAPRWRRRAGDPPEEPSYSLGRMMNGVGGSIVHYGAWLRRFHPHHFAPLAYVRQRWGTAALPEGSAVADWPISYAELEPYYARLECTAGVAGDHLNPFIPRSTPYVMPPLPPFRLGEFFREATGAMGLHPHMVPAGVNTVPFAGRPATTNTAWSNGFGSFTGDKWHPALDSVPAALATGNLDLRTQCRVTRVLTDSDGHTSGVVYVDANNVEHVQRARTVILAGYTLENVRLLLLSGDTRHKSGLGNNVCQLGKYYMTKMFPHVDGYFPDVVFNRHTGPAAQGVVIDDFLSTDFDSLKEGFIGGATLGAENQFLPIQISREALPPGTPGWGAQYRDHLSKWQHFGVVRIQPDALPYTDNFLDLDPIRRDRSALGMPVIRITYDLHPNEQRLSEWMENKAAEILRRTGAESTWRGPRFTGVCSSHDMGGCRMGEDPAASVVDPELRVHDTPGLYVFSGAVLPSCPGINPTLTLWALCVRAAERLVERLRRGEEH